MNRRRFLAFLGVSIAAPQAVKALAVETPIKQPSMVTVRTGLPKAYFDAVKKHHHEIWERTGGIDG